MDEREAVLFANEAFYRAFADRDMGALAELWSRQHAVACIHPGWPPLFGRDDVLQSWQAILGNPNSPAIRCRQARAMVHGDAAVVVCYEEIDGRFLIASNAFVREGRVWRMTHHQAGPTSGQPEAEAESEPPRVH
ncbi:MAG: nuclear transport factor 2 family protein [Alphaproteobacteria bacterium]|nr:nuclear transport factor 2 family protein [Alphaproteobacteria bacterium]